MNTLPAVIGIAGLARTGKDTLANFLLAQYGGYKYAFAEPIRRMLAAGFNINLDHPYWAKHKENVIPVLDKSPRQLMQTLGTEWGRQLVHPDVWIVMATQTLRNRGPGMIVSDLRFENEAAWVRKNNGLVLHLMRGNVPAVSEHSSENGLIVQPQDKMIDNNAGLEELQDKVTKLFEVS